MSTFEKQVTDDDCNEAQDVSGIIFDLENNTLVWVASCPASYGDAFGYCLCSSYWVPVFRLVRQQE